MDPTPTPPSDVRPTACDLVMKGGITSGVVYPSAVSRLSEAYEFRSIGGTSAGAIAAVATAAAEYGKRTGSGGYAELDRLTEELSAPGFLQELFQPSPQTKPVFDFLLRLSEIGGLAGRLMRLMVAGLRGAWWISVPTAAASIALVLVAVLGTRGAWTAAVLPLALVFALVGVVGAAIAGGAVAALRFRRGLEGNGFGICSGMPEPGSSGRALTEWLHEKIQLAAGLPLDRPLTFRDLAEAQGEPIDLRMVTTDLSYGRPVILPLEPRRYLVRRDEVERLFPSPVVSHIWQRSEEPEFVGQVSDLDPSQFRYMPADDLPVVVAARLSLSFPILMSAVRLWSYDATVGRVLENWFSDGGISSNFPIHFFDALLPGRPTFGLDLQPQPGRNATAPRGDVWLPERPTDPRRPRWISVRGTVGFLRQIADVMQNWRDSMQAELPGFRDRVCQIRLDPGEGGLNVNMKEEAIRNLIRKGRLAGDAIATGFDERRWRQHQWARYLTMMQRLQPELQKAATRFEDFGPFLSSGVPGVDVYRLCHDDAWCASAARETEDLFSKVRPWGPQGPVDFYKDRSRAAGDGPRCEPEPEPALRIVANV